eukprot:1494867-Prymnesium_polylepis.1
MQLMRGRSSFQGGDRHPAPWSWTPIQRFGARSELERGQIILQNTKIRAKIRAKIPICSNIFSGPGCTAADLTDTRGRHDYRISVLARVPRGDQGLWLARAYSCTVFFFFFFVSTTHSDNRVRVLRSECGWMFEGATSDPTPRVLRERPRAARAACDRPTE